jgi:hypothetical protein
MDGWFERLAEVENPDQRHLAEFVQETDRLLAFLMTDWPAARLFWGDSRTIQLARTNYSEFIRPELQRILGQLEDMSNAELGRFGLVGPLAELKFQIVRRAFLLWEAASKRSPEGITFTPSFSKAMSSVGTIMRSIISGLGGLPGEFLLEAIDAMQSLEKSK